MSTITIVALFIALITSSACFAEPPQKASRDLLSLVAATEKLDTFSRGDVNGDGLKDYLFIVTLPRRTNDDCLGGSRVLKIALRDPSGRLRIAASSPGVIMCEEEGGVLGDPLMGLTARGGSFAIGHAGGGNCRWGKWLTFRYSTKGRDWYLSRATYSQSHACERESRTPDVDTYRYPRHFKRITLADFSWDLLDNLIYGRTP